MQPFMVVGSAGTTNTGAVDPLEELAVLAREEGLWFHVDGAYGGLFMMTERGRDVLRGIEQADSIVLDPHKTLFLPYGTGALLVRDGATLRAVHSSGADYMPPVQDEDGLADFCELSPELSRPYRGLRIWLPIKMHGAAVFRKYLDEKLDLARWVCGEIENIDALQVLAAPGLSILAFALDDAYGPLAARNTATRRLIHAINDRQRVHVTGTMLHGVFAIRVAILALRTHREHLDLFLEDLYAALAELESD
jgi:aromatic-L-amino-acid decarboxylase